MLLSQNVLNILVEANALSPKIAGQLYNNNPNGQKVEMRGKNGAFRAGFVFRWNIMQIIYLINKIAN